MLQIYEFGEFTMDVARGCVLRNGEEIKLRPKVFETLKYLVEHAGRLISKQELMQAVWPDAFVTDDSLVQCTLELRRALDDRSQRLFKTVPRRGYLFTAPVVQRASKSSPSGLVDSVEIPKAQDVSPQATARRKTDRRRHELPVPRTSFIGRDQQVTEAADLLLREGIRLLSFTGPGGAGKTRLALAVAGAITERFPGGVQFISLASITDAALVDTALAVGLQIQQVANRSISQLIADHLKNAGLFLLILDNFEQVLPAATTVAETLEACPSLKILVTSRSRLDIYGEQEFPVTRLQQDSAIELFAQRAASVWPGFAITSENASAIQEICLRLDGLPLAIELAAARTRLLSPAAILDRLQSRLQLLTGGARDLPQRQQTLRKAIDWSHDLLNEAERKLFRRFSAFVGGCTLEGAEAVCNTNLDLGMDLIEGLSSLVDKNLVQRVDRIEAVPRFAMLETIREYSLERLIESGEQSAVRRAHAAYCLVLAEEGNPQLNAQDRSRWLALCDAEVDNFRFALDWLFQTRDLDWGMRLCVALFRFWDMREHLAEGRARLEAILRIAGSERTNERARISVFLGALTTAQTDYDAAERFLQQSLSLYEELGDQTGIASSLNALAVLSRDRGQYSLAHSYFERSLACWRLLPDRLAIARCLHNLANLVKVLGDYPRARWALNEATEIFEELGDRAGAAWSINQLGDIARAQGDVTDARKLYQRALAIFREAEDPWGSARCLTDLGHIDCDEGNHSAAHSAYREALKIIGRLGHRRGIARVMEGYACLALARGQADRALKLAAAAASLRQQIPLHQEEQSKLDQMLRTAWNSLSEAEGKRAWEAGAAMSMEEAVQYSLEQPDSAIPA
jgi:predicted ATPase/DNA-binding winged helix-turn-helix (wHTH) protein